MAHQDERPMTFSALRSPDNGRNALTRYRQFEESLGDPVRCSLAREFHHDPPPLFAPSVRALRRTRQEHAHLPRLSQDFGRGLRATARKPNLCNNEKKGRIACRIPQKPGLIGARFWVRDRLSLPPRPRGSPP